MSKMNGIESTAFDASARPCHVLVCMQTEFWTCLPGENYCLLVEHALTVARFIGVVD